MNSEVLNQQMKDKFERQKTYKNLERYAMSELLSPIEDYISFMKLVKDYIDILENLDLVFVAADLERMWSNESFFLDYLNNQLNYVQDRDRAIIYYLNALKVEDSNKNDFIKNLKKSIEMSKSFCFVNNKKKLAKVLTGKEKQKILDEIPNNIEKKYTYEDIKKIDIEEWLSVKFYIDEFITGVSQNNFEKEKQ